MLKFIDLVNFFGEIESAENGEKWYFEPSKRRKTATLFGAVYHVFAFAMSWDNFPVFSKDCALAMDSGHSPPATP
ncbi:hypothetical protein SDC9_113939 [bioreactor metagenome]|uniref:Uncharacterized protein n=1 Tax=bioreactor metagenome TaxID=1076179 RepID=A0A645BUW4_9ZZZZ